MTPGARLEKIIDALVERVLFGEGDECDVPTAVRELTFDVMVAAQIADPLLVQRRLVEQLNARLDRRLRAAVDDAGGGRWRGLRAELEAHFRTCH